MTLGFSFSSVMRGKGRLVSYVIVVLLIVLIYGVFQRVPYKDESAVVNTREDADTNHDKLIKPETESDQVQVGPPALDGDGRGGNIEHVKKPRKVESCYDNVPKRRTKNANQLKQLNCANRIPGSLIIGVKKCGTGALQTFLDLHPELEVKGGPKYVMDNKNVEQALQKWNTFMPLTTPGQITVADYPELIDYPDLLKHIVKDVVPDERIKFIIIIRDPIKRAVSDYLHVQEFSARKQPPYPVTHRKERIDGKEKTYTIYRNYELLPTFEETIVTKEGQVNESNIIISKGVYVNYIKKLFDAVDRNKVLVVDGDYYQSNPVSVLKNIESFLGITPFFREDHFQLDSNEKFYCPNVKERPDKKCVMKTNKTKGRVHPTVDETILKELRAYYQPFNRQLQDLLNQTFVWAE